MKTISLQFLTAAVVSIALNLHAATYKEAAGRVVVEAEHFDSRTTNSANHAFLAVPTEDAGNPGAFVNARLDTYLQVLPDSGAGPTTDTNGVGIDPSVNFKVHIDNPGYYQLYLRWGGWDGGSDSLYARLLGSSDGVGGILPDWYRYARTLATANDFAGGWQGVAGFERTDASGGDVPAVWYIAAAGDYTIQLSQREDGAAIDTVCFQLSSLAAPGEPGPPESDVVGADTKPPLLVEALTAGNPSGVLVVFNEALSPASATNKNNYAIDNGVLVNSVSPGLNNYSVVLNTTAITPGRIYTLTVNGVQDTAGNTIAANTKAQFQVEGFIERRVFDVSGGNLPSITNSAKFINNQPDAVTYPTEFEGPVNYRDNYGTQFRGYITPPTNGNYVFFLCSDDNSNLFLSTDENPANKKLIAVETVWSNTRQWNTSGGNSVLASKRSDQYAGTTWPTGNTITLVAGKRYYIEAIHAEGGGGDLIAVTWVLPGGSDPADGDPPIPGKYLAAFYGLTPGPISITTQPDNKTATELLPVTFTVTPGGSSPYNYQWLRNGAVIIGATAQSYTIPRTALTDNAAKFSVRIANLFSSVTSSEATLTVNADTTPPVILGAKGNPNLTEVVLTFSELLSPATATNAANYQISSASGSLSVTAAALSTDLLRVTLTTAQQTLGTKYTITVNNVTDLAATPNAIAPNSKIAFLPVGKIVEQNGFIVFEVENFDRNLDGRWSRDTTRGNPSGGASMVVPNGTANVTENGTRLEYDIEFKQAATYVIWYRASGNDGADDSAWFHIDGARPPERANGTEAAMTGFGSQLDFVWRADSFNGVDPMSVDIIAPGPHVVGLASREDGSFFDKFILTTDTAYQPPAGFGPPETREGGVGPPTVSITSPTNSQTFAAAANVTFTVNAAPSTNILIIARVEYAVNGTNVGAATSAPFSFSWNNVPQGNYAVRATAVDDVGNSTTSTTVAFKVGNPPPLVYFVTADPGPLTFAGDIAVQQRLLNRGFEVRLARGSDVPNDGSTAIGSDLIIQSSSLDSGTVEYANPAGGPNISKFKLLAIPAIEWEASNEDAWGFQEANGTGTAADQTQINIVDSTNALAAGFPNGLVTVSSAQAFSQGQPTGAHIVATAAGDPSQAVIYAYEKGEKGFNDFVMPARRVFFFFGNDTASVATPDGLKLFDAAVDWALNKTVTALPVITSATLSSGNITVQWTGGGTLESAPSLAAPITWTSTGNSTGSFSEPATGTKYYRVKK